MPVKAERTEETGSNPSLPEIMLSAGFSYVGSVPTAYFERIAAAINWIPKSKEQAKEQMGQEFQGWIRATEEHETQISSMRHPGRLRAYAENHLDRNRKIQQSMMTRSEAKVPLKETRETEREISIATELAQLRKNGADQASCQHWLQLRIREELANVFRDKGEVLIDHLEVRLAQKLFENTDIVKMDVGAISFSILRLLGARGLIPAMFGGKEPKNRGGAIFLDDQGDIWIRKGRESEHISPVTESVKPVVGESIADRVERTVGEGRWPKMLRLISLAWVGDGWEAQPVGSLKIGRPGSDERFFLPVFNTEVAVQLVETAGLKIRKIKQRIETLNQSPLVRLELPKLVAELRQELEQKDIPNFPRTNVILQLADQIEGKKPAPLLKDHRQTESNIFPIMTTDRSTFFSPPTTTK